MKKDYMGRDYTRRDYMRRDNTERDYMGRDYTKKDYIEGRLYYTKGRLYREKIIRKGTTQKKTIQRGDYTI